VVVGFLYFSSPNNARTGSLSIYMPVLAIFLIYRVLVQTKSRRCPPQSYALSATSPRRFRPSFGHRTACVPPDAFSGLYLRTVCLSRMCAFGDTPRRGAYPPYLASPTNIQSYVARCKSEICTLANQFCTSKSKL